MTCFRISASLVLDTILGGKLGSANETVCDSEVRDPTEEKDSVWIRGFVDRAGTEVS